MGLEKLDFKIVKRYFGKSFGRILKANDLKHHIIEMQPDLMIFKAPKREMKTWGFQTLKYMVKSGGFISHLGAFKILKLGWI
jgi:hypothetical protein